MSEGTCKIMFPIAPKRTNLFVDRLEASSELCTIKTKVTARDSIKKQREDAIMLWRHGFSGTMQLQEEVFRTGLTLTSTVPVSVQSLRTTVQRNQSYLATSPEKSKDVQRGPKMSKDV